MALECSDPVVVQNCELCAQINITEPVVLNSGILITVTARIANVCVGNRISIGAILCERLGDTQARCRAIASQVIEEIVENNPDTPATNCENLVRTFTFLVRDVCREGDTPRTFTAAVAAHYVLNCPCPCDCFDIDDIADTVEVGTIIEE